MNPSILLPNFRNAPLIRNNFNWVFKKSWFQCTKNDIFGPDQKSKHSTYGGRQARENPCIWLAEKVAGIIFLQTVEEMKRTKWLRFNYRKYSHETALRGLYEKQSP